MNLRNVANRARDRKLIVAGIAEMHAPALPMRRKPSYRVVVETQFLENYGAHDWDGEGQCPQYWKCKGGEDYIVAEGLTEFDFHTRCPQEFVPAGVEHRSEYSQEYILSVSFYADHEETHTENMVRVMSADGYMRAGEAERYLAGCRKFLPK